MIRKEIVFMFIAILKIEAVEENYSGEKFPEKYLNPENHTPATDDLDSYLRSTLKVLSVFVYDPNNTDPNVAIGSFFARGVIRRAISEDGHKFNPQQRALVTEIMNVADFLISHHIYKTKQELHSTGKRSSLLYDILTLFREDALLSRMLPDFNKNRLKKWILSKDHVNEFAADLDGITLPKERYVSLVNYVYTKSANYYIKVKPSDNCIGRVIRNVVLPSEEKELKPCKMDDYCRRNIHGTPAFAYSLSHKMLLLFLYRALGRCYWVSPQEDAAHIDQLCAEMYREAVYLARRGYFGRDLFLEHVGLCGMWGYAEFYRAHWFKKAIQWIDNNGCIHEDRNYYRNRSLDSIQIAESTEERERLIEIGEDFPENYLNPDGETPSKSDLDLYLDRLFRITNYMTNRVNYTDVNQAISAFIATATLKRTLLDYNDKLGIRTRYLRKLISNILNIISHYIYMKRRLSWKNLEYRLSKILKDDWTTVLSIGKFSRGMLRNWTLKTSVNKFASFMDQLSLPKEKYVELVEAVDGTYDISGYDSDTCLSRLVESMDPLNVTALNPCKVDKYCRKKMFVSPSVAYSLSHRLLNSMMYVHTRRCYHFSPWFDKLHMDMLCSAMYREAVYIARRGYFYRDIFLEQIGLCGQLGYEEFHRRRWFQKAASWIDEDGCMQEFSNFEINRTRLIVSKTKDRKKVKKLWRDLNNLVRDECHHHPMAVAMMALANGVRHAAHFVS